MSDGRLEGRVAIITGAASGIGQATALQFAKEGAQVMVSDVDEDGGTETVRRIHKDGGEATFFATDVSDGDEVAALVQTTVETYGGLDAAFNNAGTEGQMTEMVDYPEDVWDRVMGINLKGVWQCMRHQIPAMLANGGGSIVNCASVAGVVGFGTASAYAASKHGVLGLTKVAALEYSARGIRVNAVCPGVIETPMVMERGLHAGEDRSVYDSLVELHPIGRLGRVEEIADAVVWLCSDGASFVTGHPLVVDGGFVAR